MIAWPSKVEITNELISVTTITEITKIPNTQTTKITNLPRSVLVKKSPYPTVVIVMIIFHNAFPYLPKLLDVGSFLANGFSHILTPYPKIKISETSAMNYDV